MKKFLAFISMALCCSGAFAALQYEVTLSPDPSKPEPWLKSNFVTLTVTESGSLWLSGKVSNWYGSLKDLASYSDMSAGSYGAFLSDGDGGYSVVEGTGESKTVTFSNGNVEISTNAYYVGDFNAGDVLTLYVTHQEGRVGDGWSSVGDGANQVNSRIVDYADMAGNTVFNWGFHGVSSNGSIEFIIAGGESHAPSPSGQPLPGVLAALVLGGGGLAVMRRRKRA